MSRRPPRRGAAGAVALLVCAAAAGCHPTGPASIHAGRGAYNVAIQRTSDEQLLLNLVRLRYRDTPFFLEVTSVSTSFRFELSGFAEGGEDEGSVYGVGAGVLFAEEPTVTYTPLQGEDFVRQLMTPIDAGVILLLYHSGWSIDRILRVCVQRLGDLRNAPSASGPTPGHAPAFERFLEAGGILRRLQREDHLRVGRDGGENATATIRVVIDDAVAGDPDVQRLRELLGLPDDRNAFVLTGGAGDVAAGQLPVITRSLTSALFYLSQAVEVPQADERDGRVTVTRTADGGRFDWAAVTGDLFRVASAPRAPRSAAVAVRYRGSWFYIDDDDLDAKSTFGMLTQLFALQAGEIESRGPLLTLPVAR